MPSGLGALGAERHHPGAALSRCRSGAPSGWRRRGGWWRGAIGSDDETANRWPVGASMKDVPFHSSPKSRMKRSGEKRSSSPILSSAAADPARAVTAKGPCCPRQTPIHSARDSVARHAAVCTRPAWPRVGPRVTRDPCVPRRPARSDHARKHEDPTAPRQSRSGTAGVPPIATGDLCPPGEAARWFSQRRRMFRSRSRHRELALRRGASAGAQREHAIRASVCSACVVGSGGRGCPFVLRAASDLHQPSVRSVVVRARSNDRLIRDLPKHSTNRFMVCL
jgi:hypothetical protein